MKKLILFLAILFSGIAGYGQCVLNVPTTDANWLTWQRTAYQGGWTTKTVSGVTTYQYPATQRSVITTAADPAFGVGSADYTADTNFQGVNAPTVSGLSSIIRVGRKLLGTSYANIPAGNAYFTSFNIIPTAATSKIRIYYIGAGESNFELTNSANFNSETFSYNNPMQVVSPYNTYKEARFGVVCKYNYTSSFGYPQVATSSSIGMNEYGIDKPNLYVGTTPTTFFDLPSYNSYPRSYGYGANDLFSGANSALSLVAVPGANYKRMAAWKYYDLDFSEFVGLNATVTITLFAHSNTAQNSQKSTYAYYAFQCLGGGTPTPVADNFTIADQNLGTIGTACEPNNCTRVSLITQSGNVPIEPNRIPLPKT